MSWLVLLGLYVLARGYRLRSLNGVVLILSPEMERAIGPIAAAHYSCGVTRGPLVTSGAEGEHSPGSLHYSGNALDFRTRDLTSYQVVCLVGRISQALGPDYDVLDEYDPPHLHVEYDPS